MRIPDLVGVFLLLSGTASPLWSQASVTKRELGRRTLHSPSNPTEGTIVGTSVLLQVTKEEKTVKATLGTGTSLWGRELNVFARLAGPLDESAPTDPVVVGDLDGLRRANRLALGANMLFWNPDTKNRKRQREFCRTTFEENLPEAAEEILEKTSEAEKVTRRREIVDSLASKHCQRSKIPDALKPAYDAAGETDWGLPLLLGLTFDVGRQDVRYLDSTGIAFAKEKEYPVAGSVAVGLYAPDWQTYFIFALRAERSFDAGSPVQFCVATGTGSTLECRTVPAEKPSVIHPVVGRLEVRRFLSTSLGLSPRLSFDIGGRKAVGFELPVLLRQPDDRGFTSAVIAGWRSKQRDPAGPDDRAYISLVVGTTFGLGLGR